jgi:hypothetical protein
VFILIIQSKQSENSKKYFLDKSIKVLRFKFFISILNLKID